MQTFARNIALCFLCVLCLCGEQGFPQTRGPQDYVANTLTFPLQNPPQPVNTNQVSLQLLDNPGPAPYCYWIVSRFTIGNSFPAGPVCTDKGPNALVNGIRVSWSPVAGTGVTYDVLRTSNNLPPVGACNCAIATNVSGLQATDTGLNAYTISTFIANAFNFTIDNEQLAAGTSKLVYRAGGVTIYTLNSDGSQSFAGPLTISNINGVFYVDGSKYATPQAAVTDACAAGGGTVFIKPGTFPVPGTLCSSLRMIGSGKGQGELNQCVTTLTYSGSGDALALLSMNHIYLSDMCLKYTGVATSAVAIHNQWSQFVVAERLYIHGGWGVGIQLNPVIAGASTIENSWRDIHMTGFAANAIGCLIDSGASVSQVNNNNYFDNVNCQAGATGASSRGLKITGTNQINNEIVFKGGQFTATSGTGVEITAGAARNLVMIAPDIEGSNFGISIAAGNTGTILGANICCNTTTNVTDSSAGGVSWPGSENLVGVSRNFFVDFQGNTKVNGLCLGAAGCTSGQVNVPTGTPWLASGSTALPMNNADPFTATPSISINSGSTLNANQGTGAKVQHATGATTTSDAVVYNAAGDVIDGGGPLPATKTSVANQFLTAYNALTGAFSQAAIAAASITNAMLVNSTITINTTAPITGAASPALGGSITLGFTPSGTQRFFTGCNGTATASASLAMPWPGAATTACTNTNSNVQVPLTSAGTAKNLRVRCQTGGSTAGSGVFTLQDGGAGTALTCTTGTTTTCNDTTHSVAVSAGDALLIGFTTGAGETLANCAASFEVQ